MSCEHDSVGRVDSTFPTPVILCNCKRLSVHIVHRNRAWKTFSACGSGSVGYLCIRKCRSIRACLCTHDCVIDDDLHGALKHSYGNAVGLIHNHDRAFFNAAGCCISICGVPVNNVESKRIRSEPHSRNARTIGATVFARSRNVNDVGPLSCVTFVSHVKSDELHAGFISSRAMPG